MGAQGAAFDTLVRVGLTLPRRCVALLTISRFFDREQTWTPSPTTQQLVDLGLRRVMIDAKANEISRKLDRIWNREPRIPATDFLNYAILYPRIVLTRVKPIYI